MSEKTEHLIILTKELISAYECRRNGKGSIQKFPEMIMAQNVGGTLFK